ncbi:MAG: hypothetical protein RXQ62_05915 [Nitrososphaeria archaeon]
MKIAAAVGRISRADLDEGLHDLALLRAHLDRGAVKAWSSAIFSAVVDAFPLLVDVMFDPTKTTHPWEYFVTTTPLQVWGPGFELSPRGEVPAEAVEAALRELSRPVPPGTIIGYDVNTPRPASPTHVRIAREVLRRLRTEYIDEIRRISAPIADALHSGRWVILVDLLSDNVGPEINKFYYYEGLYVDIKGGFVDIFPVEVRA